MAGSDLIAQGDLIALLKSLNGPSVEDGLSDEEPIRECRHRIWPSTRTRLEPTLRR